MLFMKKFSMSLPSVQAIIEDIVKVAEDAGLKNITMVQSEDGKPRLVFWGRFWDRRKFEKQLDELFVVHPKVEEL